MAKREYKERCGGREGKSGEKEEKRGVVITMVWCSFQSLKQRQDDTDIHCKMTGGERVRATSCGAQYKEES